MLGVEGEAYSVTIPKGTCGVPSWHCLGPCSAKAALGGMQPSLERCPQPGLSLTFSAHWRWLSTGSSAPGLTCCYISCQVLELKECWCCHITACIVACLFNTITAKKIMLLGSPSKWTRGNTRYWLGRVGDEQLSKDHSPACSCSSVT